MNHHSHIHKRLTLESIIGSKESTIIRTDLLVNCTVKSRKKLVQVYMYMKYLEYKNRSQNHLQQLSKNIEHSYFFIKKKLLAIIFISVIVISESYSQTTGSFEIGMPSPNASSIPNYGETNLDLATGTNSLSIPLYIVSIADISVPITLNYSSKGVPVRNTGTWTGVDWTMVAGGVISRTVKGTPDETNNGYWNTYNENTFGTDAFFGDVFKGIVDSELDSFTYNFPGGSGKFVIDGTGSGVPQVYTQTMEGPYIEFISIYEGFVIRDKNGVKYIFDKIETVDNAGGYTGVVTAWYLTKIESAIGAREIIITYQNDNRTFTNTVLYEAKYYGGPTPAPNTNYEKIYSSKNYSSFVPHKIESDEITIEFVKNNHLDTDVKPGNYLDRIRVIKKITNDLIFEYNLDYVQTGTVAGEKKFFLSKVEKKTASDLQNLYDFDYYDHLSLNDISQFEIDHWGYFNDNNANTFLPSRVVETQSFPFSGGEYENIITFYYHSGADREVNPETVHYGMLKKVTYSTGGSTMYDYEPNEYTSSVYYSSNTTQLKKHVKRDLTTLNFSNSMCISGYNYCKKAPITISGSSTLPSYSFFSLNFILGESNIDVGDILLEIIDLSDNSRIWSDTINNVHFYDDSFYEFLPNGNYEFRMHITNAPMFYDVLFNTIEEKTVTKKFAPGVRVNKITTFDGIDTGNNIVKEYDYHNSGMMVIEPQYYFEYGNFNIGDGGHEGDIYINNQDTGPNPDDDDTDPVYPRLSFGAIVSTPIVLYGANDKSLATYGSVTEIKNGPINGRTKYYFSQLLWDQGGWIFPKPWKRGYEYTAPDRSQLLGNLESVELYDANDDLLSKTTNSTLYHIINEEDSIYLKKSFPAFTYYKFDNYNGKGFIYDYNLFWNQPISKKTVIFDSNSDSLVNTEQYYFDRAFKQLQKVTTINNGVDTLITEYKYAHEYNPAMKGLNMLSQPYSVEVRAVRDGEINVLKKHWTLWKDWGTESTPQWLPCGTWAWDGAEAPVPPASCN